MAEHYTRNTAAASAWCAKCQKRTMHRVDGVKLGPCLECIAKLESGKSARGADPATCDSRLATQGDLFR